MLVKKAIFLKTYNKYSESFFAYISKINLHDLYIIKSHLPFSGNMCFQKSKNLHLLMHTISQLNVKTRVSRFTILDFISNQTLFYILLFRKIILF